MLQQYLSRYSTSAEQQMALEELVSVHPYFTPAQFHLLLLKKEGEQGYTKLAAKNALLFNNPLWLEFQLAQFQVNASSKSDNIERDLVKETAATGIIEKTDTEKSSNDTHTSIDRSEAADSVVELSQEMAEPETEEEHNANDTEETKDIEVNNLNNEIGAGYALPAEAIHTAGFDKNTPRLKDMLTQPDAGIPDETPAFQPLYTSDYFASQGIKLVEEPVANDKLGRQMKSFTEWLKTMKKVHPEKVAVAEETNISVQVQAEKSNADDGVLTEAMAEVFILQGKPDKAAEIYHKLSLLNPAKSVFFAAKIEQLKRN